MSARRPRRKLVQSDKVDFIAGYIWSNVLLASLKTAVDSQTFPHQRQRRDHRNSRRIVLALCVFRVLQNDQTPQAMGLYMNQKG